MTSPQTTADTTDIEPIAAAERLARFALDQLTAGLALIGDPHRITDAAGHLNAAQAHADRAVRRLAELTIRSLIRTHLPTAVALELEVRGTRADRVVYTPRRVIDVEGQTIWSYLEAYTFGEGSQPDWERVVADCCESLTAVPIAPDEIPVIGPAIFI